MCDERKKRCRFMSRMISRSRLVSRMGRTSCAREKRGSRRVATLTFYHATRCTMTSSTLLRVRLCSPKHEFEVNLQRAAHSQQRVESRVALLFFNQANHLVRNAGPLSYGGKR